MFLSKISIKTNILTHMIIVVSTVAFVLSALHYYFSLNLAYTATGNTFHQIAEKITVDMLSRDKLAKEILYQKQNYPPLLDDVSGELQLDIVKRYIYTLMRYNNMYAIYSGKNGGDLIEVVNMKSSKKLYKHFEAPDATRWLVFNVSTQGTKRIQSTYYLNSSLSVLLKKEKETDYRADERPWFHKAVTTPRAIRIEPYTFESLNEKGITYAKRVNVSSTVLALDFTLIKLHGMLEALKFSPSSKITMFGHDGKVIASSSLDVKVDSMVDTQLLDTQRDTVFEKEVDGVKRFIMVTTMSRDQGANTYLSITVDQNEMLAPYLTSIIYGLIAALVLFILSIPFVSYATNKIVKPINALMVENSKIIKREFEEVKKVSTNIIELRKLSDSFVTMSKSIQAYQVAQKELMDSFIKLIAEAIDAKSPYTGGHCKRVPLIATMLVKEASDNKEGSLKEFSFTTDEELEEFERGAWLHDCGKITTPEYVVDKATKLETIYNRIHEVRMRFEVLWRDVEIVCLQGELNGEDRETLETYRESEHQKLIDDFHFVATSNVGGEFMSEERKHHIKRISERKWTRHFDDRLGLSSNELMRYTDASKSLPVEESLLRDRAEHIVPRVNFDEEGYKAQGFKLAVPEHLYNYGEVYNLCIERGTLSEEERFKIQEHVIMSIKMLEQLPFTDDMKRIPEYAGTHHETLIGTGYPRALSADELSIPAKIMAIADIFEALTASDRPYKKGKTLSQSLKIMSFMVQDKHIDGELFALFLRSGIYENYAKEYLKAEQIDDVDIEKYIT